MSYDPRNWYWLAADDRLFSSAERGLVSASSAAYAAWKGDARQPSEWPRDAAGAQTPAALQDVLASVGVWVELRSYVAAKRWSVETAGVTVGSSLIATDRESQAMIAGAYAYVQANPEATIKFKGADGEFIDLGAADVAVVANAVGGHVQASFAAEADVVAGIDAGLITTVEDVDAFSWPT